MLGGWKGALRAVQAVLLFTFGFVGPAIGSPSSVVPVGETEFRRYPVWETEMSVGSHSGFLGWVVDHNGAGG